VRERGKNRVTEINAFPKCKHTNNNDKKKDRSLYLHTRAKKWNMMKKIGVFFLNYYYYSYSYSVIKMSNKVNFNTHGQDLKQAYEAVISEKDDTNWLIYAYDKGTYDLRVQDTGGKPRHTIHNSSKTILYKNK
jgi:hypothetical protein